MRKNGILKIQISQDGSVALETFGAKKNQAAENSIIFRSEKKPQNERGHAAPSGGRNWYLGWDSSKRDENGDSSLIDRGRAGKNVPMR